jgi:signal transduction histidine kinase
MMTATLRSRLWLGYLLLTVLILGAFLVGLIYILNGSTILYRQVVEKLDSTQAVLVSGLNNAGISGDEKVSAYLSKNLSDESIRVLLISPTGDTLFDSAQEGTVKLRWLRLAAMKKNAAQNTAGITRDYANRVWIFVATKVENSPNFLVVASIRNNLSLRFLFSDPMMRLVFRVVIWAMLVSFLLTLLMDRWIARPIRNMAQQAANLAFENGKLLQVEGIREVQDLALALNKMSCKVQESRQSQRDLVSDISHELKTPLTSIQGFSAAIMDGTASTHEEVVHSAEIISSESQRMLGMVNELLTLARLESKVEKLELQLTDLQPLINGIVEKLKFNAQKNEVSLSAKLPSSLMVQVEPEKITQVFINLVENAIKFTPPGGEVTIPGDKDDKEVRIMIADTGMGIAAAELPKIFNRFYQVDRSRKSNAGKSSGLGLTIAREITRIHGGDISVESIPGKGTTFTVHLPLAHVVKNNS